MREMRQKTFYADEVKVTKACPICGKESTVAFPGEYYRVGMSKRMNGALIQDAFPESSAEIREFLITGMCLDCQEIMFSEPEDDDVEERYEEDYVFINAEVNPDTEFQFLNR